MRMSYKKLWLMLVEKEISQATLRKDLNIATGTMTKLRRNEEVALSHNHYSSRRSTIKISLLHESYL